MSREGSIRLTTAQAESGLWGLLVGDAVGVPYEFHPPSALPPRSEIELVPPLHFRRTHFGVLPGTWSDDGAQAIALLDTLVETGDVDLRHFAANLLAWFRMGKFAVNASVFDVGRQTATAMNRLGDGCPPERSGPDSEQDNGNGALMRVFPLLMMDWPDASFLIAAAIRQSRVTHGHPRSWVACAMHCLWIAAIANQGKAHAWSHAEQVLRAHGPDAGLPESEIDLVLDPAWRHRAGGSGYVVDTLWSARIAVEEAHDYANCIRRAIAFGHDTDTTAAVAGAAAGVLHGLEGIPSHWRAALRGQDILQPLLERYRAVTRRE